MMKDLPSSPTVARGRGRCPGTLLLPMINPMTKSNLGREALFHLPVIVHLQELMGRRKFMLTETNLETNSNCINCLSHH